MNIFPFHYGYAGRKAEDVFQIDESRFAKSLEDEAIRLDKTYSKHNAQNDATVVAIVLRLRKAERARDVAQCRFLFVSRNSLLQRVSRRFVAEHCEYDAANVPPVLTVGQIATIAWFVASKTLEPVKVTKELLANCYNAVRPNTGWAQEFANALESYRKSNPEVFEARAKSAIFLGAARALAREESLGQTPLLRKINFAQLLERAAREAEDRERASADVLADVQSKAEERGRLLGVSQQSTEIASRISRRACRIVRFIKWTLVAVVCLVVVATFIGSESGLFQSLPMKIAGIVLLAAVLGLSVLDLLGWRFATRIVKPVEHRASLVAERIRLWND
ncbi:MAG: hypothetical protein HC869_04090 [Rhodospirillales bacterium]|nr:hypothetical protein [Rhodospirillales bacterium]